MAPWAGPFATADGTKFTNDHTGHGMSVSTETV
jgi:hypothetical protein